MNALVVPLCGLGGATTQSATLIEKVNRMSGQSLTYVKRQAKA
jgi:hypothetical protein